MKEQIFLRYEYPIKHPDGHIYMGSYTIKEGAKKCPHFKDQKLVQKFKAVVLTNGNNVLEILKKEGI